MKQYKAKIKFTFEGTVDVNAENKAEAHEFLTKHFGMVVGDIHSVLDDDEIPDWDFPVHPERRIISISKR